MDGRIKRHEGDETSQKVRQRIEEAFGWIRTVGGLGKTQLRGCCALPPTTWCSWFRASTYWKQHTRLLAEHRDGTPSRWSEHQHGPEIVHVGVRWPGGHQIAQRLKKGIGIVASQMVLE